jgi:hypothetical protein
MSSKSNFASNKIKDDSFDYSARYGPAPEKNYKKPIAVALEIIIGCIFVGIGVYLAQMHGIGTIGLIEIGGGGGAGVAALAIITIFCLRKKSNALPFTGEDTTKSLTADGVIEPDEVDDAASLSIEASRKMTATPPETDLIDEKPPSNEQKGSIKGELAIIEPETAGPLGKDISNLFEDTRKVQRTDSKDWREFPNEILIRCQISNIPEDESPPLKEGHALFLPFCLFVKDDDYTQWKEEGEIVEFDYEGRRYELTLSQKESNLSFPLKRVIEACERSYKKKVGSILPRAILNEQDYSKGPSEVYISPIASQRDFKAGKKMNEQKQKFLEAFSKESELPALESPVEPPYDLSNRDLIVTLTNVSAEDIRYFFSETSFAIYALRKKVESSPPRRRILTTRDAFSEYLLVINFDETLKRDMIENGVKNISNGELTITFPAKSLSVN